MTDNIKPPWAAQIWCNHYTIYCELPGPNDTSHAIQVNNDIVGLRSILTLIQTRNAMSTLGSKGDPTKLQIASKDWLKPKPVKRIKSHSVQFSNEQRTGARQLLRKMGLI